MGRFDKQGCQQVAASRCCRQGRETTSGGGFSKGTTSQPKRTAATTNEGAFRGAIGRRSGRAHTDDRPNLPWRLALCLKRVTRSQTLVPGPRGTAEEDGGCLFFLEVLEPVPLCTG